MSEPGVPPHWFPVGSQRRERTSASGLLHRRVPRGSTSSTSGRSSVTGDPPGSGCGRRLTRVGVDVEGEGAPKGVGLVERPFVEDDFFTLRGIERASGPASWSFGQLRSSVRDASCPLRVITADTRTDIPIAFYQVERSGDELYIRNIAVDPAWRRRGVATFMLERIEVLARELGLQRVALTVQEENLAAQLLYRSCGYRAVEIERDFYPDGDGYRMCMELGDR